MLHQRTTTVEELCKCPLKYKEVESKDDDTSRINMFIGDICHLAHQDPDAGQKLADQFFDTTYIDLVGRRNNILKEKVDKIIEMARDRKAMRAEK